MRSHFVLLAAALAILHPSTADSAQSGSPTPNVLMIVVDDLAASVIGHPAYGRTHPSVQTPAMDRLCNEGIAFTQAYSNWPACMPAREMFMSGKNIETTGWRFTGAIQSEDGMNRHLTYLHQHFHANGYNTIRLDKVFHIGADVPEGWDITEEPFGQQRDQPVVQNRELETLGLADSVRRKEVFSEQGGEKSAIFEMAPTDRAGQPITAERLTDGITRRRALELLDDFATPGGTFDASRKPFFMAVGFRRPHLPFVAPREYYGRFNWGEGDDNVADPATPPIVLPPHNRPFKDEAAYRQSLEAYYACTAMTDDHIAALLDKLDKTGLAANTIVVFLGDNGYGLGEKNKYFSKGTSANISFHVPLVFRIPGGHRVNEAESKAVTLLDLYPTLVDLCGLSAPQTPLDGKSLAPLLERHDPDWVEAAYAFLGGSDDPADPLAAVVWGMGYKLFQDPTGKARELFAVGGDDRFEWEPLLDNPEHRAAREALTARLASMRALSRKSVPPAIDTHPVSQVVAKGGQARFEVREAGATATVIEWFKDGVALPGQTAPTLLIDKVSASDAGLYVAHLVNANGRARSYPAALKVIGSADELFDWQIDETDAPFILDGINGTHFSPLRAVTGTFGAGMATAYDTKTEGRAIVRANLPPGEYRVSIWNPDWREATPAASVTIHGEGETVERQVDQKNGGKGWVSLGEFRLGSGTTVSLSTRTAEGRLAVDGLRFERITAHPTAGAN